MPDELWLVAGLGNPGPRYAATRHNIGFMVADALAASAGERFTSHKAGASVATLRLEGARALVVKPMSFMNLSGGAVAALARFYKVPVGRILAIHDELDLPLATLRLKAGGGAGGHNGLRSLTQSLGSPEYLRLRVGIGRPPGRRDPADYVLSEFTPSERGEADVMVARSVDAIEVLLTQGLTAAQNLFHAPE